MSYLGKMSIQVLCSLFHWVICFSDTKFCEFFIYFGYEPLIHPVVCRFLLSFTRLSFHQVGKSPSLCKIIRLSSHQVGSLLNFVKASEFGVIPFVCFHFPCLRRQIKKNIHCLYFLLGVLWFQLLHGVNL